MSRSRLSWFLALLLVVQTGLTAGHCLRAAGIAAGRGDAAGLTIVLCTAEGLRSVVLPAATDAPSTDDAPGDPGSHSGPGGACLACHALPDVALPAPPAIAAPGWTVTSAARPLPPAEAPRPPARAQPGSARGPPTLA